MSWINPTGFVDSGGVWTSETLAYDEDTVTYAYASALKGAWTNYLELTHDALDCDKVQVWVSILIANINAMEVDVCYSADWHNIYSGAIIADQFVEYPIGSTQSVTAMRIRFNSTKASTGGCRVHEADFNEVELAPYYHGLNVQGEGELALCDIGNHPLRVRKGGVTYGLELVATDDPNASGIRIKTGTGIKAIRRYT